MRKSIILALVLLGLVLARAADQQTLDQLKQRATAAKPGAQPKLFLEVAEWQLREANDAYHHNDAGKGQAAVHDVVTYCERAVAAAKSTRKHLKETEIKVRDLSRKLDDMRRSAEFDDRPPLETAIERLEMLRRELLTTMFGSKS